MTKVAVYPQTEATVIKNELWDYAGFCRAVATVEVRKGDANVATDNGTEVGTLLIEDGDGTWSPVADDAAAAALVVTDQVAILVDSSISTDPSVTDVAADRADTAVFVRGPAIISVDELLLGDGTKVKDNSAGAKTAIEAVLAGVSIASQDSLQ